ncbi:DUF262 domain-containing protein [Mucilaginibacter galii]|uniref:GmrSD restriction endonucleases N-terminal domain-containing protein n=1 Tax=Mucilaginibacter galii TaxID=2005073 RepID=A0A917N1C2_9SPHI|nr:DUF262 domain-containing protein [Mucilaginibacter galii]GGI50780.1 hypothetical protein GCM10011425_19920 [Mucilaginibacter galii]
MSYNPPISVKQAIEKIDYNQYLLPAIQREFVWESVDIELLFDSLMRNYPIGSLLMWKVQGENKVNHRFYSVLKTFREKYNTHCKEVNTNSIADFEAILDGQQRLTALYIGLKGSYAHKKKNFAWKDNEHSIPTRKLHLCLTEGSIDEDDNEDGRVYDFKFLTNEDLAVSESTWFEVGKILEITGTFELNQYLKREGFDNDEFISSTLFKLFDVVHVKNFINYYLETDQDYDKALNIFIRINSGGEKLSYSDLIMSTIISVWSSKTISAREEFNNLIDEIWQSTEIVIDKDLIIRTYLLIFSQKDIKFRVTNFSVENAIEFKNNWLAIREAIAESIELVKSFGYVEQTITSKNALLPIIHYLFISGKSKQFKNKVAYKEDRDLIKRWFHTVLLKRIFGGQADTVLKIIRDVVQEEIKRGALLFPATKIAKTLSKTRKSITMDDEAIENLLYTTYEDRYAFPILALLYPHLDYKNNDFNKDHIFPKSQFNSKSLKKHGIDLSQEKGNYYTDNWCYNGIVNLQMFDSNENKSKSDKTFEDWIKSYPVDFNKQILPRITEFSKFIEFVDIRWDMLKEKLKLELTF